jgi:protein ImuA
MASDAGSVLSSGFSHLDAQLPGGGWPLGSLTELLQLQAGCGEWGLLLPALASLLPSAAQAGQGHAPSRSLTNFSVLALVGAPHVPLGAALQARGLDAQRLLWVRAQTPAARAWACEQALRCADVAAVLAWLPQVRSDALRRLHLAAHDHGKLLWVLRPIQARHESSPAPLRLMLGSAEATPHALSVSVLKRRGPPLVQPVVLAMHSAALQALLSAAHARAVQRRGAAPPVVTALASNEQERHVLDRLAARV